MSRFKDYCNTWHNYYSEKLCLWPRAYKDVQVVLEDLKDAPTLVREREDIQTKQKAK